MSATMGTRPGQDGRQLPRRVGVKTFLVWLGLSLLAFVLGGYLGHAVAGPVDGVAPALIGGALTGAAIGLAQWLVLRRLLGVGPEWIVVTSVGLAVGLAFGALAIGYETSMSQLAIMGAISGGVVGIGQGLVLRSRFSLWWVWMIAMPALWALGWVVMTAVGVGVGEQFTVFGASGTVVFAVLSLLVLAWGVRRDQPPSSTTNTASTTG